MTKPVQPPKPDFLGRGARKPFNVHEVRRQIELHPERLVPTVWLDAGFTVEDWAEWEALPESPYESGDIIAVPVIAPDQIEAGTDATLEPITVGGVPNPADQSASQPMPSVPSSTAPVNQNDVTELKPRGSAVKDVGAADVAGSESRGGRPKGTPVNGGKLRKLRELAGLTQAALAEKCETSVDTIQRGEAGGRWPDQKFKELAPILSALTGKNISAEDLQDRKN